MSEELKPCPFCGDSQFSTMDMTYMHESGPTKGKRIKCQTCGAQAPDGAWNHRAELAALKAGQGEAVGKIWAMADGKQYASLFTEHMNSQKLVGARLYTAPPASADAVSVPVELLKELIDAAEYGTGINNHELIQARALLARSESKVVKS